MKHLFNLLLAALILVANNYKDWQASNEALDEKSYKEVKEWLD